VDLWGDENLPGILRELRNPEVAKVQKDLGPYAGHPDAVKVLDQARETPFLTIKNLFKSQEKIRTAINSRKGNEAFGKGELFQLLEAVDSDLQLYLVKQSGNLKKWCGPVKASQSSQG